MRFVCRVEFRHAPEGRLLSNASEAWDSRQDLASLKHLGFSRTPRYWAPLPKQFITEVIQRTADTTGVASAHLAAEIIDAIKTEITTTGGFTLPGFGRFTVRETLKRSA